MITLKSVKVDELYCEPTKLNVMRFKTNGSCMELGVVRIWEGD